MRKRLLLVVLMLGVAVPALAEMVIETRDGRTFRVPLSSGEVGSIRFTDAPAAATPAAPAAPPAGNVDVAGTWRHGSGGETWTFTPLGGNRYRAVEKGFANASGTATVTGNRFRIDFTWQNGQHHGYYEMTVEPDGRTAKGRWWDSQPREGGASMTRVSTPATAMSPAGNVDIAGTWRHGPGGETWTFTPLGGNRYRAVEKGFANASGTATVTGHRFRIDFTWQSGQHHGYYEMTVEPDGRTATGRAWDSRPAEGASTMTRLSGAAPAPASTGGPEAFVLRLQTNAGVQNRPSTPTVFTVKAPVRISKIMTYHFNGGQGARPGTIGLRDAGTGRVVGSWNVVGTHHVFDLSPGATWPAQGDGPPFLYWTVRPDVTLSPGTYEVVDSDPATWSTNADVRGMGVTFVYGME